MNKKTQTLIGAAQRGLFTRDDRRFRLWQDTLVKRFGKSSFVALAILACAVAPAGAETFQVLEDTYSTSSTITKAAGSAASLLVSSKNAAYIKFGVTNATFTASEVSAARLVIYFPSVPAAGTLELFANSSDFSEVLKASSPAPTQNATSLGTLAVSTVLKQNFAVMDVTGQVQAWLAGTMPDYGFAIKSDNGAKVTIGAKEGPAAGYPAVLEVDISPSSIVGTNATLTGNVTALSFTGNGSGLTALNASNLAGGTIPLPRLPAAVVTNTETGLTLGGAFTGTLVGNATTATTATMATTASNTVSGINLTNAFLTNAFITNSSFAGNGGGLTNLNVMQLSGPISVAQLPGAAVTNGQTTVTLGDLTLTGNLNLPDNNSDTGIGYQALAANTTGIDNTAIGADVLPANTSGDANTAVGNSALFENTTGRFNTAVGHNALLYNTTGGDNTAVGNNALANGGAGNDIALGPYAGVALTNGSEYNDIDIGNNGVSGDFGVIRIGTSGTQHAAYIAGVINGNGGGLTNLDVAQLSGPISAAQLPAEAVTNNATSVTLNNLTLNGTLALGDANGNIGIGSQALQNNTGGSNIAVGVDAGGNLNTGSESNNIDIGNSGMAGENGIIGIGTTGVQTATYLVGTVYADNVALTSDRNAKENFTAVNVRDVLAGVAALPMNEWNYKKDSRGLQHLGPMAQDFHSAFGLNGMDDKHISAVDESGVALAAIQGLNQKLDTDQDQLQNDLKQKAAEIEQLRQSVAELKAIVSQLTRNKEK